MLQVTALQVESRNTPLGIDIRKPRFRWQLVSDRQNVKQASYDLRVSANGTEVWSEANNTEECLEIVYAGMPLRSRTRYTVTVTVTDNHGETATAETWFESGLFREDWKAQWVEAEHKVTKKENPIGLHAGEFKVDPAEYLAPPTVFHKNFTLKKKAVSARLYMTAHGVYDFRVNGKKTSDRYLAPDFTPYDKWLCYQTYDVTDALVEGDNRLDVTVADGWYAGFVGIVGAVNSYGKYHALLAQLEVTLEDGTKEVFCTDRSVTATEEELVYSDIYVGEKADFTASPKRIPCHVADYGYDLLTADDKEGVFAWREFPAKSLTTNRKGERILDLGQVIAGMVRFTIKGERGQVITLDHTEALDKDGNFFRNISGSARQYEEFVLSGEEQTIEARHTFHGFRYIRLGNFPADMKAEDFTAVCLSSDTRDTVTFECDNRKVNRLWENTIWSQKTNTISIPTDCPQRERAGWTGDMQVYSAACTQNADCNSFLSSWLRSVSLEQMKKGQIPMIVPYVKGYRIIGLIMLDHASACWGDVAEVVTWRLYNMYGNRRILEEMYPTIRRWVQYIGTQAAKTPIHHLVLPKYWKDPKARELEPYLWNTGVHYGDWLVPSISQNGANAALGLLTKPKITPPYYFYALQTTAKIAKVLGLDEDVKEYEAIMEKIKEAYDYFFVHDDGTMSTILQGAYVLGLHFGLIPEEKRKGAVEALVKMIEKNGNCLDTGFASVEYLLDVLCENGYADKAYEIFFQEKYPSWLYEVNMGATTIWESWKSITPEGKVVLTSLNHYAYGCVDDWIYRHIVGLNVLEPGYKTFEVRPHPECGLKHVKETFESVYGPIEVEWSNDENGFRLNVAVPANTEAVIVLPNGEEHTVGSGIYTF